MKSISRLTRHLSQPLRKGFFKNISDDGPSICGDIDIRIGTDGTWFYMGTPIARESLVRLFANTLIRDEHGDFWLVTPHEMCRIKVDDAPFTAVELLVSGTGINRQLTFKTNVDEKVRAGRKNAIRVEIDDHTGEPRPYIEIRDGIDALILRSVFYEMIELGEEKTMRGRKFFGVWSDGVFFELGALESG
tara:strand:+ start:1700 stop:2269 length:570 start_codon:yes stop_codon:yes gene_type:complete